MAQYKVIAYSAHAGKKIHRANAILKESDFKDGELQDLLSRGFIAPYDEEEELKAQIEAEKKEKEKSKK